MNVVSQTERIATLWVPAFSKALSAAYLAIHTPADCMSSVHLQLINRPRKEAHAIFSLVSQKSVASQLHLLTFQPLCGFLTGHVGMSGTLYLP